MPKKLTTEEFIIKSNIVHNFKYDYSLVNYIKSNIKVKIICPIHGIFEQTPNNHLGNRNCPKCNDELHKLSIKEFIEKSNLVHNFKYDYSLVKYINIYTKVKIICPIHGIFEQIPHSHIDGNKCYKCRYDLDLSLKKFIEKSTIIHNDKYDYSSVVYKNAKHKVKIICKKHGIFDITPNNHLRNRGCPICLESKGEEKIKLFLNDNNMKYISQKTFNNCKNKNKLKFDFYLPDYNLCIEYDGKQHYSPIDFFGGENNLNKQKENDKIKNEYCKNYNIHLLRIKFTDFKNIENILSNYLLEVTSTITPSPMTN